MKIQLSYLKGISIICLSLFLPFFTCSSDVEFQAVEMEPPLTDVLTLELSFGDERTIDKDEFLLAKPNNGIDVDDSANVYISDEDRIKVFDNAGRPVRIIGNPGDGPGEFRFAMNPVIGANGLLAVNDGSSLSIFALDGKLIIDKKYMNDSDFKEAVRSAGLKPMNPSIIYPLNESDMLFRMNNTYDERDEKYPDFEYVLLWRNGTITTIAEYQMYSMLHNKRFKTQVSFRGKLLCTVTGNKLALMYGYTDKSFREAQHFYSIHVVLLGDYQETVLEHTYDPVPIPESLISYYKDHPPVPIGNFLGSEGLEAVRKAFEKSREIIFKIIEEDKYMPPVQQLLSDRNRIFAFTHTMNEQGAVLVDIFDINELTYECSAWFPVLMDIIKNGYAYRINKPADEFPAIEKYKIDPAVYGK